MDRFRQLAIITLAVTLAAAIGGCDAGDDSKSSSPTDATTASAPTPPRPARRLAAAPTNCTGPAPRMVAFGDYGNLIGTSPVWAGVYAAFDRRQQAYHVEAGAPRTVHGWRVKDLWIVAPKIESPVRVVGGELGGSQSLWFEVAERDDKPVSAAVLDPARPGVPPSVDGYKEFPSYVYIPRAGCYFLEARWPGGHWRLVFGLGR
jgi:hypothetical protein